MFNQITYSNSNSASLAVDYLLDKILCFLRSTFADFILTLGGFLAYNYSATCFYECTEKSSYCSCTYYNFCKFGFLTKMTFPLSSYVCSCFSISAAASNFDFYLIISLSYF